MVAVPVLGLAALLGCSDLFGTDARQPEADLLAQLEPGIHPVLVVAGEGGGEATVELHLKRVAVTATVASFQGELTYDVAALALAGARMPEGIMGVWNETEKGKVRFSGVSLEGIGEGAVLSLQFTTARQVEASAFTLKMEELVGTEGFENLTEKVKQKTPRPLLSRTPLR
jgi:hypothetical protein